MPTSIDFTFTRALWLICLEMSQITVTYEK